LIDVAGTNKILEFNNTSNTNAVRLWNTTTLGGINSTDKVLSVKVYDSGDETEALEIYGDGKIRRGYKNIYQTLPPSISNASFVSGMHYLANGYNSVFIAGTDLQKGISVFRSDGNSNATFVENFSVSGDGKTVIGNLKQTAGIHTDALLSVNGKAVAKSVFVTMNNWADYVFESDYALPKLEEVEAYYKKHKHLPEIPSAQEVIDNGVDLGDMNKLLLKKIEELTILMVAQQKEINILKTKIK
jgi:hypothetical protein